MKLLAVHMNPANAKGKTSCGRRLRFVRWREDIKDVTCDSCLIAERLK